MSSGGRIGGSGLNDIFCSEYSADDDDQRAVISAEIWTVIVVSGPFN